MYRLYGNIAGWKELDRSNDELDIVDTIGYCIANNSEINYTVIKSTESTDEIYRVIKNRQDYINYLNEVKDKCANLKNTKKLTK